VNRIVGAALTIASVLAASSLTRAQHTDAASEGTFSIVARDPGTGELGMAVQWSFTHITDAAAATLAALERGAPGVYNVADDEPAPVREWLPFLANAIGAPPPGRIPGWLARMLIGHHGIVLMNETRGCSNEKAKAALAWRPRYASWRTGFVGGLGEPTHQ
jgi:nucleoside-diphosphate-sugar epimerase